jgi:hypothetical protein
MNTPDPRSQDLADRLARRAGSVDLGPPVVDVVIGRGRQRRQRRRTAVGVTAVVGICGASVVAIAALSRPSDNGSIVAAPTGSDDFSEPPVASTVAPPADTVAGPPATVTTTPATPISLAESPFVWNRVDPAASEAVSIFWGGLEPGIAGSGPFLAWSTSPGRSENYEQMMWRSDDGISWEQVTASLPLANRSVVERAGRFFSYGTTPATSPDRRSDVALSTSDDGGVTWTTEVLPIDTSAVAALEGVDSVGLNPTSIASSPTGVLLSVQLTASVDFARRLPAEYRGSPWELDDGGLTVRTGDCLEVTASTVSVGGVDTVPASTEPAPGSTIPAGCDAVRLAWSDLGVSEAAALAALRPSTTLMLSTDGQTFEEVAPPATDLDWSGVRLTVHGDGFAAVTTRWSPDGTGTSTLWFSADGRSWSDTGELPLTYPETLASTGDRLVASGWADDFGRQVVAVRDASGAWTITDLGGFVRPEDGVKVSISASHVAVDGDGISMVGWMYIDPIAEMGGTSFTTDGITVYIDDMEQRLRVVDASTDEPLATIDQSGTADTDLVTQRPESGRWDVRLESGGEVAATFSYDDVSRAIEAIGAYGPGNSQLLFLHSADGVSWSRESLDEIAGAPVSSSGGFRVADDRLMLAVNLRDEQNSDGTPKQVVLIATPKS